MRGRHFTLIILFTLLTSAFVWVRLQIVSISYEIHELRKQEQELRAQNTSLNLKIHEMRSPYRLEQIARANLKMQAPRPDQIIVLQENSK